MRRNRASEGVRARRPRECRVEPSRLPVAPRHAVTLPISHTSPDRGCIRAVVPHRRTRLPGGGHRAVLCVSVCGGAGGGCVWRRGVGVPLGGLLRRCSGLRVVPASLGCFSLSSCRSVGGGPRLARLTSQFLLTSCSPHAEAAAVLGCVSDPLSGHFLSSSPRPVPRERCIPVQPNHHGALWVALSQAVPGRQKAAAGGSRG